MPIASINPATGETLKIFQPHLRNDVENKIALAEKTFYDFRTTSFWERSTCMTNAANILETEKEAIGRLMTLEMGKTFESAKEEAVKCAWACRYYAENAGQMLADETVVTNASRSFVHYQPLGIILAIMPWNFPFWQVFRFAAPALMAGNVALLKHASNVPQCALKIEEIFRVAGFAEGVFQTLLVGSADVKPIIEDPRIRAITLTGSEPAGCSVASLAGKLIKKTVLELGGSDPFIVMPSADIDEAAKTAVRARVINNGQSCIAAKRFIVHESIFERFMPLFVKGMETLTVGDPMLKETDVGPIASEELLRQLDDQVKKSVAAGAKILAGGNRFQRAGSYYAPTVLTKIPKNSPAYHEEFFGPVALLFKAKNIDEAIRLANDTPFGLGSSVWTHDVTEQKRFINELDSGLVFINGMVASDPRLPFGGVKHSGFGRELGTHGIKEFVNIKTIWIK
jgi:succinate-semialdehyde dehydrogenase/glutarate-semialdehyde dehydrogenase